MEKARPLSQDAAFSPCDFASPNTRPKKQSLALKATAHISTGSRSERGMSSESSDDIDEDELLQIALKEQAERDINYHRPTLSSSSKTAPSKPVVNLIQHPQSSLSNKHRKFPNHTTTANSRRGGRPQDDDDSDVELLSISSGDDDSFSDRRFAQNFTGGPAKRKGGGDNIRGDRRWNSDEPDSWKRVDEGELGRRVREMRETRAAPVTQDLERKGSTLSHKGLANLQSLSRGREFVDPLGLGIIDIKSLTLIRDASESSPVSVDKPDKDILDPSAYEKLLYYSEQFDAKLFLSRIHQDTSAADLESGALVLKSDLKGRTQQRKQLVKENFDCFVSCKTTIDDIRSKLKRIEEDPEGAGTAHLYHAIHDVSLLANRAFEPLFERQVQAEKIRSVQGILQRFRTLFNLPSAIRGNISKGEYDLAVREYRKAKSIVLPSHVGILRSVLEEVEKVMQEFKGMLYKSLEESQLDLAELENTIWLLLDLEPELDPVWHYLNIQDRRIRGLLEKCTLNYEERMEVLHGEMQERVLSDKRWKLSQQDSNKAADVVCSLLGDDHLPVDSHLVDTTGEVDALRGRYIFWLTAVLINHLPAFWRLAVSMLTGKFLKSSHASGNMLVGPEATVKAANSKTEDSVNDVKYTSHSLDEVAEMVDGIISTYETKVHNVFRDFEPSNILCPYMSEAIKEISKACQVLEGKESAPASAVKILQCLHMDITKIYILSLCSWMHATAKEIAKDELWVPVSVLERNNSPYTISFMPLAFCSVTISAMDQIMEMIENLRIDAMKTNDMFVQVQEIQESIRISFLNCFLDFVGCLEQIASGLSQSNASKETAHLCNGSLQENEVKSILAASVIADSHQKLLMVLSNVGYCKDQVAYDLYNKYKLIWLQSGGKGEGDSDIQDLVSSFAALEEKVLEQYTYAKANLIRTAAFNYLLDSGILWGGVPSVKGIRDAAVELLHVLVAVHAEVFAGARPMLEKILGTLVEGLIDTFLSLFHEHSTKELKSLDANGFCQLMLELEYFETVLGTYFTPDGREALKSLQGLLLDKASNSMVESSENPGHHRRPTRGSEEAFVDDRQQGIAMSPDDLIVLAQHHSSELLNTELERTRINIACFMEPSDSVPEIVKPSYSSFRGSLDFSSRNHRAQPGASPSFSRQRRR